MFTGIVPDVYRDRQGGAGQPLSLVGGAWKHQNGISRSIMGGLAVPAFVREMVRVAAQGRERRPAARLQAALWWERSDRFSADRAGAWPA